MKRRYTEKLDFVIETIEQLVPKQEFEEAIKADVMERGGNIEHLDFHDDIFWERFIAQLAARWFVKRKVDSARVMDIFNRALAYEVSLIGTEHHRAENEDYLS